jgi:hypothetical protein
MKRVVERLDQVCETLERVAEVLERKSAPARPKLSKVEGDGKRSKRKPPDLRSV